MYIKIRVAADAKRESVIQKSKDHFEIFVKEKAEMNMANKRVRVLVALKYKIPVGKVRIISGHHSPSKILSVDIEA